MKILHFILALLLISTTLFSCKEDNVTGTTNELISDIILGYSNDDNIIYEINIEDGSLTPKINSLPYFSWQMEYLESTEQIITTTDGNALLIIDIETGQSSTLSLSDNKAIERLVVTENDIVYGISNDDNVLYQINLNNGNLTAKITPTTYPYRQLEYLKSTNQIIATIDGSEILIIDLSTGESISQPLSENKAIERLVVTENDIVYGISNDDNVLYQINLNNGNLTAKVLIETNFYREMEFLQNTNQLISTIDGNALLIIDIETGQSSTLSLSDNKAIERLVIVK